MLHLPTSFFLFYRLFGGLLVTSPLSFKSKVCYLKVCTCSSYALRFIHMFFAPDSNLTDKWLMKILGDWKHAVAMKTVITNTCESDHMPIGPNISSFLNPPLVLHLLTWFKSGFLNSKNRSQNDCISVPILHCVQNERFITIAAYSGLLL